jgi:hypothetical protein
MRCFGHDEAKLVVGEHLLGRPPERFDVGHGEAIEAPGAFRHLCEISPSPCMGRQSTDRLVGAVVKHDDTEIFRKLVAKCAKRARAHQHGSISLQGDHPAMG